MIHESDSIPCNKEKSALRRERLKLQLEQVVSFRGAYHIDYIQGLFAFNRRY